MFENSLESIKKAQTGDKVELGKLIRDNNRTYMDRLYRIYKINTKIWYKFWGETFYIFSSIYDTER